MVGYGDRSAVCNEETHVDTSNEETRVDTTNEKMRVDANSVFDQ